MFFCVVINSHTIKTEFIHLILFKHYNAYPSHALLYHEDKNKCTHVLDMWGVSMAYEVNVYWSLYKNKQEFQVGFAETSNPSITSNNCTCNSGKCDGHHIALAQLKA